MKARWTALSAKVDAMNRRERVLVLLAMLALVTMIMNTVLLDSVSHRTKSLTDRLTGDRAQLVAMKQQIQTLEHLPPQDPDAVDRARLAELDARLLHANGALDVMQRELVSPDRMTGLLEDILKQNSQLKLLSLKTLPETSVATAAGATDALPIYRHGVELKVQGRYLDLLGYLRALEHLSWHMLWGNMSLAADAYPQSTLTMTIYTMSLDRAWLTI